jgi:GH15 family glucan-1,4-alpha-glucosidase
MRSSLRFRGRPLRRALATALALLPLTTAAGAGAVVPHRSVNALPSSNGIGAIAFDRTTSRITQFLEHPYRFPGPNQAETRNFAYDSYPGIRVNGTGVWLPSIAPSVVEYVPGTGILHVNRATNGLSIDEYHFTPMALAAGGKSEHASVMLVKVTRTAGTGPVDVYTLFNYHLGAGAPAPDANGEQAAYSAAKDALYEYGPSGVAFGYGTIGASGHHATTPSNPYTALLNGQNLADNNGTSGPTTDAVTGTQVAVGNLAVGASAWTGTYTVLDPGADALAAVDRVKTWINARTAEQLYNAEVADWNAWIKPNPAGASPLEDSLATSSQVMLRMGQVREPGAPYGQMLASLATGRWNISWVRDMSYAVVALARTGHLAEAKAAIDFQMKATVGDYQTYVGRPYALSVVRYYGNGREESDSNQDGPNVEYDGFGLFLWELDEYVKASNDTTALRGWWPKVSGQVADTLIGLQEPSGQIAADSSIWEVHWNGKQRHFTYTTATAANGLCGAGRLATALSEATSGKYTAAGVKARDALLGMRAPDGSLVQSPEGLAARGAFLDASVVEAMNFGLIDPTGPTARATRNVLTTALVPPSRRGFMRSDVPDWYDQQEWVFVDFRAHRTFSLAGDTTTADPLFAWNVAQGAENFGILSELHERNTADYAGEAPMVGFGAGSYLLALGDRGKPVVPSCGAFAAEAVGVDAGIPSDGGASDAGGGVDAAVKDGGTGDAGGSDGGSTADAGATGGSSDDGGCTVPAGPADRNALALAPLLAAAVALIRRRRAPSQKTTPKDNSQ